MGRTLKTACAVILTAILFLSGANACAASDASVHVSGHIVAAPPAKYRIFYHPNGGTGSFYGPYISAESADTVLPLTQTGIIRPGYTFAGWNSEPSGGGTAHFAGGKIILNSDTVFYAQWKEAYGGRSPDVDMQKPVKIPKTGSSIKVFVPAIVLSGIAALAAPRSAYKRKKRNGKACE